MLTERDRMERCVEEARVSAAEFLRRTSSCFTQDAWNYKMAFSELEKAAKKMHTAFELAGMFERGSIKE